MSDFPIDSSTGKTLQFDTVERAGPQELACANCKQPISTVYHKLNQHVLCSRCRQAIEAKYVKGEGTSASRFARAAVFGIGGGIAGAVVYALVLVYANIEAGLLAVLVGYLVGRGVRKGSGNRGGWRYQALAMGLTYLAVSGAYMPIAFQGIREQHKQEQTAASSASVPSASTTAPTPSTSAAAAPAESSKPAGADAEPEPGAGAVIVAVLAFALALPVIIVLSGSWFSGLMLGFALYQAWKINKRLALPFIGPVQVPVQPVPAAAVE